MKDQPLIHWGIPGMKWGVRRKLRTNMDRSVKQKYGQEALDNRRAASAHKANVKVLKKQIQKADIDNFNRASKIISKKEKKMNAELDALQAKQLKDIDASKSMGAVKKFLAKGVVKMNISAKRDNIIGKLEDQYHFSPDAKRVAARKKALKEITKKYDDLYIQRSKELDAKKLGGLADLKEFLKIDKELSRQMTEDILRAELEIEQTNYDN